MSELIRNTQKLMSIERYLSVNGFKNTTYVVSCITSDFLQSKNLPFSTFNKRYKGIYTAALKNSNLVNANFRCFKNWLKLQNYPDKFYYNNCL